jgi:hypothetical protein
VAIGFLANQVGLGDIGTKIAEIIGKVRAVVDMAIDWLLDKLQAVVDRVLAMIRGGGDQPVEGPLPPDELKARVEREIAPRMARPFPRVEDAQGYLDDVFQRYRPAGLKSLTLKAKEGAGESFDVLAAASSEKDVGNVVISTNVIAPKAGDIRYGAPDSLGRATKAFGWLRDTPRKRDKAAQSRVSEQLNKMLKSWNIDTKFHAGHLIAAEYGGSGGEENLVAQESGSNLSWWRAFEKSVKDKVESNQPGDLIYMEVRPAYTSNAFAGIASEDDLVGIPPDARAELRDALLAVPEAISVERIGRRKADGTEEPLPIPGPFDVRASLQTLGRSLAAIVVSPVSRSREVFER